MVIKTGKYSIPNAKSHGLDAFNNGFHKATWEDIGLIVCCLWGGKIPK